MAAFIALNLVLAAVAATLAPSAGAAVHYKHLSELGIKADRAVLQGRVVTVRIRTKGTTFVRFAVVRNRRMLQAWNKVTLKKGSRKLTRRLNRTPASVRNIKLRVTGVRGRSRARGFIRIKVIPVAPPPGGGGGGGGPTNSPPTALGLSNASVAENQPAGTTVGTLTATDPNPGDAKLFSLVLGTGSIDNAAFTIAGGELRTAAAFDRETKSSYSIRVRVDDGAGGSFEQPLEISVTNVDEPPATTVSGTTAYAENDPPTALAPALTLADVDSTDLTGATVRIATGYQNGADRLALPAQPAISGAFDASAGTLTLTGSTTVAAYQDALRAVTYDNTSDDPATAARSVTFTTRDAGGFGTPGTRSIALTAVNDAPAITTSAGPLGYAEGDPATVIDAGLVLADPDSQIAGATVRVTGNHASPEDLLALPAQPAITGSYDSATGTLTLSGTATVAAYQAALQAVTYRNTSANPSALTRTVSFQATDTAAAASNVATRAITISGADNAPDVDNSTGSLAYTENDPATAIDTAIAVSDVDSTNLTGATVQITAGYVQGQDLLALPAQPVITASFDAPTGRLTLSGTDTVAAYETALEAVTYRNTSDDPSTATRTVTYQARDVTGFGSADTHAITIAPVDDAPIAVDDNATVGEDSGATVVAVLGNDTDVDAGPKSVASVTQPANGAVVNNGTDVSYAPDANYCNTPPGTTLDTFTYTLSPGGSSATVAVSVTCADDSPVAVNDSATVGEDSGAGAVDVLANDTDIDGGPKAVASVTQPANGIVVNNGTGVSYAPNANYCNTPPGATLDTFTYTLSPGGSAATVAMTVTCADDSPVAVDDSATVGEDSAMNTISVLANDTDIDAGPKSVASVTQPANGTALFSAADVSYTPAANYCNSQAGGTPDTFTYTINGGSTATVSVTVTCAPDAPVVNNSAGALLYVENDPATPVDPAVTVTDVDPGATISSATVQISANFAVEDVLALANPLAHPLISAGFAGATLTLSGSASVGEYQAALRDVTYFNSSDNASTLTRTLTFTVVDNDVLSGSDTRNVQVSAVDDPPAAVNDSASVGEDSGASTIDVLANDTDADGGPKSVATVTQPTNGSVTNNTTDVSYAPNANYCNNPPGGAPDTFTYTLSPGGATATVAVTVNCANDAPVVNTTGGNLVYIENDPATPIAPAVTVTDADAGATIASATVQISANYAAGQDLLALANAGTHAPITASVSGDTLTLSNTASPAAYQSALRDVTYANSSEGPSTLPRTATFTVVDDTVLSGSDTRGIQVTAVNDPPTAVDDTGTTDEDTALNVSAPGVLANDTDVDPGDTKTVVALNGTATLTQTLASGASVTIAASGSYMYNPLNAFQGLSTGQTGNDSFTYTMQDSGGAQSTATVSITINGVSDAPVATDDTFTGTSSAVGNTALIVNDPTDGAPAVSGPRKSISGDILANDNDPDTVSLSVTPGSLTSTDGGKVTLESDGDFVYTSDPVDQCLDASDSFDYTVTDGVASDTGTVNVSVAGCVWYVNNNDPTGNSGTSTAPFDTLAQAQTSSLAGDSIFVFAGDTTTAGYSAGIDLKTDQKLVGEVAPLVVGADTLHSATPAAVPKITDTNADVVKLASGNTVRGVRIDPGGTGGGIAGGNGTAGGSITSGTIRDVVISDTAPLASQPGLELDTTAGTFDVTDLTVDNSGAAGVRLNNAGTVNFVSSGTISITTAGAKALDATGPTTNLGAGSVFDAITVTGSGAGAVAMSGTIGTTTFGDLSLTTTSGTTAAFALNNVGNVTVSSGATANVSATGGPAIDVQGASGASLAFDDVDSTNSSGAGILLSGLGSGTFSANASSSISNPTGTDFSLTGGSGAITYDGTITDDVGQLVSVSATTGGTKDFNGTISDGGDGDGSGISLSSNTGATIRFDGGLTLATGANPAFSATGGGTLAIPDPAGATNNTVTTTTGTALNVTNTNLHSDGATFEKISASGAANGVVLNSTGAGGGLTVTGAGSACAAAGDNCTGGTIQSTTGDAISLTSTSAVSLTRVRVINNLGNGIRGSGVTNFTLADSVVDNNADDAASDEAGLHFTNLAGTAAITRSVVSNSLEDNARIINSSGTLAQLNVTDSTFRDTDTVSPGNNGLLIQADGGSITADVLGSTFLRNRANGLQVVTNGTGSMNVEVDDSAGVQSSFDDNNIGVSIAHNSSGTFSYAVRDLTIDGLNVPAGTGGSASPININLAGFATTPMVGTVSGNTLTNSNSTTGPGIRMIGNGAATMTSLVDANVISAVANRGIEVIARDGSNRINATVTNNSVTLANGLAVDAIRVDAGTTSTDTTTICADIRGNTATTAGPGTSGIRVRQRFAGTTFILEGLPAGSTDAQVATFLSMNNNAATASADHANATGFATIANCPTPP